MNERPREAEDAARAEAPPAEGTGRPEMRAEDEERPRAEEPADEPGYGHGV